MKLDDCLSDLLYLTNAGYEIEYNSNIDHWQVLSCAEEVFSIGYLDGKRNEMTFDNWYWAYDGRIFFADKNLGIYPKLTAKQQSVLDFLLANPDVETRYETR